MARKSKPPAKASRKTTPKAEKPPAQPVKRKGGNYSPYTPTCATVARVMSLEGSNQAKIARALDVTPTTIIQWRKVHPEFAAALKAGKDETGKVVASVLKMAKGYKRKAVKPIVLSDGAGLASYVKNHDIVEYYPPNLNAALRWLKVHLPEVWGDAGTGTIKQDVPEETVEIPMSVLQFLTSAAEKKQKAAA